ncbi:hypothetical protein HN587_01100 [Candidatus Woesearchaeota archaeon]|jgi:hypothetical protein|nr:hypothetical protein [Candidatus Woesearchaeota archaeon]
MKSHKRRKYIQNTVILAGFFILLLSFLFGVTTEPGITGSASMDVTNSGAESNIITKTWVVTESVMLTPGVYDFTFSKENGIAIAIKSDNLVLDCRGSIIRGNNVGVGIYAIGVNNVTLKDCNIEQFKQGIYVDLEQVELNSLNSYDNSIEDICVKGRCSVN